MRRSRRLIAGRIFITAFALIAAAFLSTEIASAERPHVTSFGKWTSVQGPAGNNDSKPPLLRMRALIVDGRGSPRWQWERGGWLLVDRMTGRISPINLPGFDTFHSTESWFRDYVAYCGVSDDGKKVYAIVAQISRRKPVMKNLL